jgi:predicted branched-subunit amino acid permease
MPIRCWRAGADPVLSVTARSGGRDVRDGVAAMAPLLLGYAPFALVIGSTVATVDQPVAGWAGSWLIFGGSAHLAALQGVADGSALLAIVTALLVNTRLLLYSASLVPRWRSQPRWFRLAGAALLVDPTWALAEQHADRGLPADAHRRFYLAAALTLGAGWSAMVAAGALAGDRIPTGGMSVVVPLCLVALLGPRLRDHQHRWAATAAAGTAVVTAGWPAGTGILAAIAAGCVAATLAEGSVP